MDKEKNEKNKEKNMIQIYCGDGKGKTTAAVGLAVRAAGHRIPVLFAQFLKGDGSGETAILKELPQVTVMHPGVFHGFTKDMDQLQKEEIRLCYVDFFKQIEALIRNADGGRIVVILDEVLHACNHKLLSETKLCRLLDSCPAAAEIVLTGREPSEDLQSRADYISEIKKVRHPYDKGIGARKGIEF